MQAIVKVSHLKTEDAMYRRGDIVDFPEERIKQLGSSVAAIAVAPVEPEEVVVEDVPVEKEETVVEKAVPAKTTRGRKKR